MTNKDNDFEKLIGSIVDPEKYLNNLDKLKEISKKLDILVDSEINYENPEENEYSSEEGKVLILLHKTRERDQKLVKKKKKSFLEEKGSLYCEVCNFNFSKIYGKRGKGFIECHHNLPISQIKKGKKTKLTDLSLLCSNCHRMIHRQKPWLTVDELRNIVMS